MLSTWPVDCAFVTQMNTLKPRWNSMLWTRVNFCSGQSWWHAGIKQSLSFSKNNLNVYLLLLHCHRAHCLTGYPGDEEWEGEAFEQPVPHSKAILLQQNYLQANNFWQSDTIITARKYSCPRKKNLFFPEKKVFPAHSFHPNASIKIRKKKKRKGTSLAPVETRHWQPLSQHQWVVV